MKSQMILAYGKYTQEQWRMLSYDVACRVVSEYHLEIWRKQWEAQVRNGFMFAHSQVAWGTALT